MDVFIYFTEQLPCGLDELEDSVNDVLGELGEVSGTGSGEMGGNIDIEIFDDNATQADVIQAIRVALSKYSLPLSSYMTFGDMVLPICD